MIWKVYAGLFGLCVAIQALTGWDFLGQFFTALENPVVLIAFIIGFYAYATTVEVE
jgi:hypothetical protein